MEGKRKKALKRVAWADEVGRNLIEEKLVCKEMDTFLRICSRSPGADGLMAYHEGGVVESLGVKTEQEGNVPGRDIQSPSSRRESYKEVLLRTGEKHSRLSYSSQVRRDWERIGRRFSNPKPV